MTGKQHADLPAPNRFELIGYLEEALPDDVMVRVEEQLRTNAAWRAALVELRDAVDLGEHSIATIWRRHRLTCPSREDLGAYLIGAALPEGGDYIRFHLEVVGCRLCQANVLDLEGSKLPSAGATEGSLGGRRRRFFESSVGYIPKRE